MSKSPSSGASAGCTSVPQVPNLKMPFLRAPEKIGEAAGWPQARLQAVQDELQALASDRVPSGHPHPSAVPWVTGVWQERLSLCASETSATEPGYLAGAVSAAERAALEVAHRLAPTR